MLQTKILLVLGIFGFIGALVDSQMCSTCSSEFYILSFCNATHDTVCAPCKQECENGTFQTGPCTNVSEMNCTACLAACPDRSLEIYGCNSTHDRRCDPFVPYETDGFCRSCTQWPYSEIQAVGCNDCPGGKLTMYIRMFCK